MPTFRPRASKRFLGWDPEAPMYGDGTRRQKEDFSMASEEKAVPKEAIRRLRAENLALEQNTQDAYAALEQVPDLNLSQSLAGAIFDLKQRASAEIHMAEVQRDEARQSAKRIVLDLIEELSAKGLTCWLCCPNQFKLAVIARLDNWK